MLWCSKRQANPTGCRGVLSACGRGAASILTHLRGLSRMAQTRWPAAHELFVQLEFCFAACDLRAVLTLSFKQIEV
jgi:hypothetical protein